MVENLMIIDQVILQLFLPYIGSCSSWCISKIPIVSQFELFYKFLNIVSVCSW